MLITTLEEYNAAPTSEQQNAVSKFVGGYVQCCQTTLIEYVIQKSLEGEDAPMEYEDITNNVPYGHIDIGTYYQNLTESERDSELERYEYLRDKAQDVYNVIYHKIYTLGDAAYDGLNPHTKEHVALALRLDSFETKTLNRFLDICDKLEAMEFETYPEIYEWWACDRWLIAKLEAYGECTLDGEYWGRCTTGQSIILDSVIIKIFKDGLTN
jgi:hypothetical protein